MLWGCELGVKRALPLALRPLENDLTSPKLSFLAGVKTRRPLREYACPDVRARGLSLVLSPPLFHLPLSHEHLLPWAFFSFFAVFSRCWEVPALLLTACSAPIRETKFCPGGNGSGLQLIKKTERW